MPLFCYKEVIVSETFEVYYQDTLEYVKALFRDSNFAADLVFKLEHHYIDANHTKWLGMCIMRCTLINSSGVYR